MKKYKYIDKFLDELPVSIGSEVKFSGFIGKVVAIEIRPNHTILYHITYFVDGKLFSIALYNFELDLKETEFGFRGEK